MIQIYPREAHHASCAARRSPKRMPIVNSPRVGACGYTGPFDESLRFEERMPVGKG